jgi:hypothetical protein
VLTALIFQAHPVQWVTQEPTTPSNFQNKFCPHQVLKPVNQVMLVELVETVALVEAVNPAVQVFQVNLVPTVQLVQPAQPVHEALTVKTVNQVCKVLTEATVLKASQVPPVFQAVEVHLVQTV